MALERFKATYTACLQLLSSKIAWGAIALLVLGVVGRGPIEHWAVGNKDMMSALTEVQHNVAGLLDNPLVRLLFVLGALWLFTRAAIDVENKSRAAEEERQGIYLQALQDVRAEMEREYAFLRKLAAREEIRRQMSPLIESYKIAASQTEAFQSRVEGFYEQYDTQRSDADDKKRGQRRNVSTFAHRITGLLELAGLDTDWNYPKVGESGRDADLRVGRNAQAAIERVLNHIFELGRTLGESSEEVGKRLKA